MNFLDLKRNTGIEEERTRDLFIALWVPDLFMKRVETDQMWSLMCPHECPGLPDCYGKEFEELYTKYNFYYFLRLVWFFERARELIQKGRILQRICFRYEKEERYRKQIPAREVWKSIVSSQIETGTPYMVYKDACNEKSNQKNLGIIKCSNLCTEIIQYSSPEEIAVCNLASIALNRFVKANRIFDFYKLKEVLLNAFSNAVGVLCFVGYQNCVQKFE